MVLSAIEIMRVSKEEQRGTPFVKQQREDRGGVDSGTKNEYWSQNYCAQTCQKVELASPRLSARTHILVGIQKQQTQRG
jgi:hypothetical protein